ERVRERERRAEMAVAHEGGDHLGTRDARRRLTRRRRESLRGRRRSGLERGGRGRHAARDRPRERARTALLPRTARRIGEDRGPRGSRPALGDATDPVRPDAARGGYGAVAAGPLGAAAGNPRRRPMPSKIASSRARWPALSNVPSETLTRVVSGDTV